MVLLLSFLALIFRVFCFFLHLLRRLHRHRHRNFVAGGSRRRGRRRVEGPVETGRAFSLDPSFEIVVLPVTHEPTTRTEPPDHSGNDSEDSDHRKYGDNGSD
ncbi:LOW QUALITY PROTEIN: hypothetical protein TorRG33x02_011280 [Trema orientale]|uniref:Uncharacterized protein n=1 Tax=Trema orientale TaxID=63057 RepID=A0A2P5FZ70_TREOI|nr:LOW QUALITY PROTEIN: hypothetical protein TorRG33x02_011280 [Trema orientale]